MNIPGIIIIVLICIALFIALREFYCWYFKINGRLEEQKKTNLLLTKILLQLGGTLESKSQPVEQVEDTNTYDFIDDNGKVRNVTTKTGQKAGWTLLKNKD